MFPYFPPLHIVQFLIRHRRRVFAENANSTQDLIFFPPFTLPLPWSYVPAQWSAGHQCAGWWITHVVPNSKAARRRSATYPLVPLGSDNSSQGSRPYMTTEKFTKSEFDHWRLSDCGFTHRTPGGRNGQFSDKSWKTWRQHSSRLDRRAILCGIVVICDILYQDSNTKVNEWMNEWMMFRDTMENRIAGLRNWELLGLNFTKSDVTW